MYYLRFILSLFVISISSYSFALDAPLNVVKKAADGMINELQTYKQGTLTEKKLEMLVEKHIQPAIDLKKIAMGALGKYWRRATSEQQKLFIQRFRELQIRTYSNAFMAFSGGQFNYQDVRYNKSKNRALVKTQLQIQNQKPVAFDFKLYYNKKEDKWLIYSASVAGLNLVKTYRDQVQSRLQKISMDELLKELQSNKPK